MGAGSISPSAEKHLVICEKHEKANEIVREMHVRAYVCASMCGVHTCTVKAVEDGIRDLGKS